MLSFAFDFVFIGSKNPIWVKQKVEKNYLIRGGQEQIEGVEKQINPRLNDEKLCRNVVKYRINEKVVNGSLKHITKLYRMNMNMPHKFCLLSIDNKMKKRRRNEKEKKPAYRNRWTCAMAVVSGVHVAMPEAALTLPTTQRHIKRTE